MATKVQIIIDGLFLYVPDSNAKRLTLLAPHTDKDHFGHSVEEHALKLIVPTSASENNCKYGDWRAYDLPELLVLPPNASSGSATATLPPEIHDLEQYSSIGIDPSLTDAPHRDVRARIQLWSGKSAGASKPLKFEVGSQEVDMSNRLTWEMDIAGSSLDLPIAAGQITLTPVGNTIRFFICHMPPHHLPGMCHSPTPSPGDEAIHFPALFSLFENMNPSRVKIPKYKSGAPAPAKPATDAGAGHSKHAGPVRKFGGDPVTCVGGSSPPK